MYTIKDMMMSCVPLCSHLIMCYLSRAVTGWHQATTTESSAYARSSSRSDRKMRSQMTATVTTAWISRGWVCELDLCTHDSVDANDLWKLPGRRRGFEDSPFLGRLRTWPPEPILTSNLRPLHAGARDLWHWHHPLTMLTSPCVHPSGPFTHPFVCSADLHPYHCSHDLCTSWVEVKTVIESVCERERVCVRK